MDDPRRGESLNLDQTVGIGMNRLGALLAAPALEWSIEQPEAGEAAVFRGHANGEPDDVHRILDRWNDCFGLPDRCDHDGIRENTGLLRTHDAQVAVRLIVWGITNRDQFDA